MDTQYRRLSDYAPDLRLYRWAGGTRTHDLLTPRVILGHVAWCRWVPLPSDLLGSPVRAVPSVRPVSQSMQAFRRRDTRHTYQHCFELLPENNGHPTVFVVEDSNRFEPKARLSEISAPDNGEQGKADQRRNP